MRIHDIQCFERSLDDGVSDGIHIFERWEIGGFNNSFIVDGRGTGGGGGTLGCGGRGTGALFTLFGRRGSRRRPRSRFPPRHRRLLEDIRRLHVGYNIPIRRLLNITYWCHICVDMFDGLVDMLAVELGSRVSMATSSHSREK